MGHRSIHPVTAGLSRLAELDRHERALIVRQMCRQYPAFRSMLRQVSIARGVAMGSALALSASVVTLASDAPGWVVAGFVFSGMGGLAYVTTTLSNSRFDLLLAVLGAHRTDELHSRLITEQVYAEEVAQVDRQRVVPSRAVGSRLTGEPSSSH